MGNSRNIVVSVHLFQRALPTNINVNPMASVYQVPGGVTDIVIAWTAATRSTAVSVYQFLFYSNFMYVSSEASFTVSR
jgi:hypothetical protein